MNHPEQSTTNSQEVRRGKELRNRSLAALSAVGVAVLAACGPTAEAQSPPTPEVSQSTEAPVEVEQDPIEVGIEVDTISAELPTEQLIDEVLDRQNDWLFQGATTDTVQQTDEKSIAVWDQYNGDYQSILKAFATENADAYAEAAFVKTWKNDPSLVEVYDNTLASNIELMDVNVGRHLKGEALIERTTELSNIVELEGEEGQRIIKFDVQETDTNTSVVYAPATGTYTLDVSDGTARIAAMSYDIHN